MVGICVVDKVFHFFPDGFHFVAHNQKIVRLAMNVFDVVSENGFAIESNRFKDLNHSGMVFDCLRYDFFNVEGNGKLE